MCKVYGGGAYDGMVVADACDGLGIAVVALRQSLISGLDVYPEPKPDLMDLGAVAPPWASGGREAPRACSVPAPCEASMSLRSPSSSANATVRGSSW